MTLFSVSSRQLLIFDNTKAAQVKCLKVKKKGDGTLCLKHHITFNLTIFVYKTLFDSIFLFQMEA